MQIVKNTTILFDPKLLIFTGIISIKDVNIIAYICVKLYIVIHNNY